MNVPVVSTVVLALLLAAGCATQTSRDLKLGPTFTDDQKELMTDEEKLAIYNAQVRDVDQLTCEMVKVAGSHRPQQVCQTEREREWNRKSSEQALRKSRRFQNCLSLAKGCEGAGKP